MKKKRKSLKKKKNNNKLKIIIGCGIFVLLGIFIALKATSNKYMNNASKKSCDPPPYISVSSDGKVKWEKSKTATSYQISMDGKKWVNASSGVNYLSQITSSKGTKKVYVRSVCNKTYSNYKTREVKVYNLTLKAGKGINKVYGYGNYISGKKVKISAEVKKGYLFKTWTGNNGYTYRESIVTVNKDMTLTAHGATPEEMCKPPTNVKVSPLGIVTWSNSSTSLNYQISMDKRNWTKAKSGVNYLTQITSSTGTKYVYVRAVCGSNYTSSAAGKGVNVYKVSLTAGTGVSKVYGYGNYIAGRELTISASLKSGYTWQYWSKSTTPKVSLYKNNKTTIKVTGNISLTAHAMSSRG